MSCMDILERLVSQTSVMPIITNNEVFQILNIYKVYTKIVQACQIMQNYKSNRNTNELLIF